MARQWTEEEEAGLLALRHDMKLTWQEIGRHMGRSAHACEEHAYNLRKRKNQLTH